MAGRTRCRRRSARRETVRVALASRCRASACPIAMSSGTTLCIPRTLATRWRAWSAATHTRAPRACGGVGFRCARPSRRTL
eukprot:scaffold7493_cov66-Phaeocystis_antarctica.AAC.1